MGVTVDFAGDYFNFSNNAMTDAPLTMAAWIKPDSVTPTGNQIIMSLHESGSRWHQLRQNNDIVRAFSWGATTLQATDSGSGLTAGNWHHACAVFFPTGGSSPFRAAYVDGGGKGTGSTDPGAVSAGSISIANRPTGNDLWGAGSIAELAWWDAALDDNEVAALGAGYAPPLIRPQNLQHYFPGIRLVSGTLNDRITGSAATAAGDPTDAGIHPPVIYPSPGRNFFVPAAAAGGQAPRTYHHQHHNRAM